MVRLKEFLKGAMQGILIGWLGLLLADIFIELLKFIVLFSNGHHIPGWLVFGFVATSINAIIFGLLKIYK